MTNPDTAAPPRAGSRWMLLAKIAVSVALLWLLISRIDVGRLWSYARHASPSWLVAALALYLVSTCLSVARWGRLLHTQHVPIANGHADEVVRGGDVLQQLPAEQHRRRCHPHRRHRQVCRRSSRTLATTVVFVDRLMGLMGLAFVAAIGASAAAIPAPGPVGPRALWGGLAAVTAACAPALIKPESLEWILRPLRVIHAEWIDSRVEHLTDGAPSKLPRPA